MYIDESGKRYGRLTVLKLSHIHEKRGAYFHCICDCGLSTVARGFNLRTGKTKSCGCLKREAQENFGANTKEKSSARMKEFNKTPEHRAQAKVAATKHGGTGTRLFKIWEGMRERCSSDHGDHARWYHDKGITVCEEWQKSFETFRSWAFSNGYVEQPKDTPFKDRMSIDRIDPQKGYYPENCRFITISENSRLRNEYHANQR